jgi:hypothetical protein
VYSRDTGRGNSREGVWGGGGSHERSGPAHPALSSPTGSARTCRGPASEPTLAPDGPSRAGPSSRGSWGCWGQGVCRVWCCVVLCCVVLCCVVWCGVGEGGVGVVLCCVVWCGVVFCCVGEGGVGAGCTGVGAPARSTANSTPRRPRPSSPASPQARLRTNLPQRQRRRTPHATGMPPAVPAVPAEEGLWARGSGMLSG